jgi:ASC-1-like (ASCH) protein
LPLRGVVFIISAVNTKNYHLVILKKPYVDAILAGRKTIESRFTRAKHSFISQIKQGDILLLKASSGPVCGQASVSAVRHFEDLTPAKMTDIKRQYNEHILGSDEYWKGKAGCRFGFLAWLEDVRPVKPRFISKKDWRSWVVLTPKENFGLLKDPSRKV